MILFLAKKNSPDLIAKEDSSLGYGKQKTTYGITKPFVFNLQEKR
jgi:hypothetical protein